MFVLARNASRDLSSSATIDAQLIYQLKMTLK